MIYAHTKTDEEGVVLPEAQWQPLCSHLDEVVRIASQFGEKIGLREFAIAAGRLHDIGKTSQDFQDRLHGKRNGVDHKSLGAEIAVGHYGDKFGRLLAYAIQGHHGGMPDGAKDSIYALKGKNDEEAELYLRDLPEKLALSPPQINSKEGEAAYVQLLIRMIFSCLVDADYLDTERFMTPEKAALRPKAKPAKELCKLFCSELDKLLGYDITDNPVYAARRDVLNACLLRGREGRGFYTLTVPTGGGKTLSSLAFALEQIQTHDMDRIIFAMPFTTIIEQNADVYREIFGDEYILEHHSNIDPNPDDDHSEEQTRLACQNWDAPLIVTTSVQLLESLFSHLPSRCRKVHSMANSVIIFDEAQALPDKYIRSIIVMLKSLVADFGATVVFCTATQPYLKPEWMRDLNPIEIISDTASLFDKLRRVSIEHIGKLSDEELEDRLSEEKQALIIVNTRAHAFKLYKRLSARFDGVYHLSALMCPKHRTEKLKEINNRLAAIKSNPESEERCIVVSTQLLEAGVDIDFPCVYRAEAGLESIAQSAGRCNRNGKLPSGQSGRVYIFTPEEEKLPTWLQENTQFGREVLALYTEDPLSPSAVEHYFKLRYHYDSNLDNSGIVKRWIEGCRDISFPFRTIGGNFRMIEEDAVSVIIPYDDKARELLKDSLPNIRKLQRYTISVYRPETIPYLKEIANKIYVLNVSDLQFEKSYSEDTGLNICPEEAFLYS